MIKIDTIFNDLREIDHVLFDELKEVNDFEAELYYLEYELDEEIKVIAQLHNTCRSTVSIIRHLHSMVRNMDRDPDCKTLPIFHDLVKKQLDDLETGLNDMVDKLESIQSDESAGKKIVTYCKKVEAIVRRKLSTIRQRLTKLEEECSCHNTK